MQTGSSSTTTWIAGALLWMAWLVPNHYPPWACFYSESAAVLWAVVIVSSHIAAVHGARVRVPLVVCLLLAVSLIPWVQRMTGLVAYNGDAALAQLYLVGAALCWWAGATVTQHRSEQFLSALAWTLVAAAIASTGIALYQWFGLDGLDVWAVDGDPGTRVIGNISQSNHLATLLLSSVLATWYLHSTGRIGSRASGLVVVFSLIGLALAQSRTSWLAAAIVLAWTALNRRRFDGIKIRPLVTAGLLGVYAVFYVVSVYAPRWLLFAGGPVDARMEAGLRPLLWKQMLAAIEAAPWQGFGWLQIHVAQGAVASATPGLEYSSYAHNLALDLMIWNGIPIGAAFLLALCFSYYKMTILARGEAQWMRWALITVFGTHAMLEYPHAYTYLLLPMTYLAGQLQGQGGAYKGMQVPRAAIAVLALLATAASGAVMNDYIVIEREGRVLRMELVGIRGASMQASAPSVFLLDNMAATVDAARIRLTPGMNERDIDVVLQVARRYPSRFFLSRAIITLAVNGRLSDAIIELHRYRGIHGDREYQRLVDSLKHLAIDDLRELAPLLDAAASRP